MPRDDITHNCLVWEPTGGTQVNPIIHLSRVCSCAGCWLWWRRWRSWRLTGCCWCPWRRSRGRTRPCWAICSCSCTRTWCGRLPPGRCWHLRSGNTNSVRRESGRSFFKALVVRSRPMARLPSVRLTLRLSGRSAEVCSAACQLRLRKNDARATFSVECEETWWEVICAVNLTAIWQISHVC